jgi:hypothetical protein
MFDLVERGKPAMDVYAFPTTETSTPTKIHGLTVELLRQAWLVLR